MKRGDAIPWLLAAGFGSFAFFILAIVFICFRANNDLVSASAYEDGLRHQDRQEALARAAALPAAPTVSIDDGHAWVVLPPDLRPDGDVLELTLYRAQAAAMDRRATVKPSAGASQVLGGGQLAPGPWTATMSWRQADIDYRIEQQLVVARPRGP
jgi:hypothetical protein